jgi:hypothetical protein
MNSTLRRAQRHGIPAVARTRGLALMALWWPRLRRARSCDSHLAQASAAWVIFFVAGLAYML